MDLSLPPKPYFRFQTDLPEHERTHKARNKKWGKRPIRSTPPGEYFSDSNTTQSSPPEPITQATPSTPKPMGIPNTGFPTPSAKVQRGEPKTHPPGESHDSQQATGNQSHPRPPDPTPTPRAQRLIDRRQRISVEESTDSLSSDPGERIPQVTHSSRTTRSRIFARK